MKILVQKRYRVKLIRLLSDEPTMLHNSTIAGYKIKPNTLSNWILQFEKTKEVLILVRLVLHHLLVFYRQHQVLVHGV